MCKRYLVKVRGVFAGVFIGLGLATFATVWWNNDKLTIRQPIISYDYLGKSNI